MRFLTGIAVPVALLMAGGMAWGYFKATAPKVAKQAPQPVVTVVDTTTVEIGDAPVVVTAMGTVTASREVSLTARVSGQVQALSAKFYPGGHLSKGERILILDPADYTLALDKARSALADAQGDLAIEQGNQTIAREEMRLLAETGGEEVKATDLLLRKPQLQQAQAAVASAEADLRAARLDLARTVVTAPFNAMITVRNVNIGSHVSTQDSLVTLVDTDEYWVEAVVPLDQLVHLDLDAGAPATIRSQTGKVVRTGRAIRTTGQLSDTSRMATVIIAVRDPLGLRGDGTVAPLVLGDYVAVEIQGKTMTSIIELPREALRDGDTVWVYDDGKLDIRPVTLSWKDSKRVFITGGIRAGTQVVVSDLALPVQGMQLKQTDESEAATHSEAVARKAS